MSAMIVAKFELASENYLQRHPWSDIVRCVETDEFFLFFYNKRMAHYLPKRAIGLVEAQAIRELIEAHRGAR